MIITDQKKLYGEYLMIIPVHILLTFISLVVLLLATYMRGSKRSLYMIYSFLAILLFNLGFLVEISAPIKEVAIIGKQMKYLGLPFISPLVLLFILDYYGYRFTASKATALLAIPVLHSLAAVTFPWNGLFYSNITWVIDASTPHLETKRSIIYYIGFFYSSFMTISILLIAIFRSRRKDYAIKKQSNLIIASAAIPGIGNAVNVLAPLNLPFDPTALLLTTGCTLLAYSFLRLNLFQIAPIAREQIIENIRDAFVLVDRHKCFIDANAAAKKLFPQLALAVIGTPIDDIEDLPFRGRQGNINNDWSFEIMDECSVIRHYTISKTSISQQREFICDCLMIYDVTESKNLLDHVNNLAEHDTLTGLINRRTFFSKGELLFQEIASLGSAMSALMIDVDHFKKINDTYGHQIGDEVLSIFAQKLSERFRSTDLFARYGGEEFCALLPMANEAVAMKIAHELREITACIDWEGKLPGLSITISIGVAVYTAEYHGTLDALVGCADTALYAAKGAGRNAVCNYKMRIHTDQLRLF